MSISHAGYAFENPIHGTVKSGGFEIPIARQQFFATIGEVHLIGQRTGRPLTLEITLENIATLTLMETAIATIAAKVGQTGTLTVDGHDFTLCTFEGFAPAEAPWKDGTGNRGYVCRGVLTWRQRAA